MHQPARWGLAAAGAGSVVILGLDLTSLDEMNPLRRTISEHGLGPDGWIFGLGVGLLAAGSLAIGVSLARKRLAGVFGIVALLGWSVGLLVTAWFEKHDWSVGPSLSGSIHRVGSFVAFLSLPLAALIIARPWRHRERSKATLAAFGLGICSVLWVAGIGTAMLVAAGNGTPWYRVMPLGLVERGLAVTEVAALLALGVWAAAKRLDDAPEPVGQGRSVAMRSST
ncbi:DUF998 domain-containing protein [Nonomuraea gerenzanensis]|uniref:DUF998 domain-containing protein n=1 Tax=Nonomuraea gerenzanensis TaxID=93944 RepID=A0A1M4EPY4_9ACTN|nr:DUF998 domain-containing protein [Nonomuraea gerenzanensis]UBU12330.1 DUF998 domain-containing protein [Nonomuraea gerenzanensis]SBP00874.1 hypothetical protein BN4615_P10390 [Nonomuraea gerenzanensis]